MTARAVDPEELANAITHGVGLLASLAAGAVLITLAALTRDPWQIVGASVYVVSLVVLYAASTAYHAARDPRVKARLKLFDHCAIFGLIAGSYTPFTLVGLRGGWGWTLFGLAWGLAAAGIVAKLFLIGRFHRLSTLAYLAMGWMAVVAIGPLVSSLPGAALAWMLAGGVLYTLGTPFYHAPRLPYGHAVWHLFVLAGSACHFAAVLVQLLPALPA
ncbi:MAG TPA: hemolysin III family protein [Longimicrobiaceae bacterium]|nr:hemolysin III family protein [Longimicrobiaceae bacterium]